MRRGTAAALIFLVVLVNAVAPPPAASDFDAITAEVQIEAALEWLSSDAFHADNGYWVGTPGMNVWYTANVLWLFDWLTQEGWDVSAFDDQAGNAKAWLESTRNSLGTFYLNDVDEDLVCNETTAIANLVVPSPVVDHWFIDSQMPDGFWTLMIPGVEKQNYPSVTSFVLYDATCRDNAVDYAKAYAWLDAIPALEPEVDYYTTRFYVTFLLAAVASMRAEFPVSLTDEMAQLVAFQHDGSGTFEGRTMSDNPSAVVSTALALQTAVLLDRPELSDIIDAAAGFLMTNFEDNHWWGGYFGEAFPKDESVFATLETIRALAMTILARAGQDFDPCTHIQPPDDDTGDDSAPDDTTPDDDDTGDDSGSAGDDDSSDEASAKSDDDESGGCGCG